MNAPRIPRRREFTFTVPEDMRVSRGDLLINALMGLMASCAFAILAAHAVDVWILAPARAPAPAAAPAPAVAPVTPRFSCPAPVRAGEVASIVFRNDGVSITTQCQLTRDWQLLNPRGQNLPNLQGK